MRKQNMIREHVCLAAADKIVLTNTTSQEEKSLFLDVTAVNIQV